jgi:hypothetical protein
MGGDAKVFEVWRGSRSNGAYAAGEEWSLTPPASGSVYRIAEFPPSVGGEEPYMHRTPTIDFGVVLEGELTLVLASRLCANGLKVYAVSRDLSAPANWEQKRVGGGEVATPEEARKLLSPKGGDKVAF